MKKYFTLIFLSIGILSARAQYGSVDGNTKEFTFKSSLAGRPYMFYGYTEPNRRSKKLILFSTYPMDISTNKLYTYPLGAYHETTGMKEGEKIIYSGRKKNYAEMKYIDGD